ncbi:acyl-CoA dehydrogenase family protein, partial [Streptococcus pneumoniae]|nr:acyl-CoA dehydrogenase family protein [Streptococcus pneumoniae]
MPLIETPEHEQFRQMVRRFVKDEIAPNVEQWEHDKGFPAHDLFGKMGALGMLGSSYPEEYGGVGGDYL